MVNLRNIFLAVVAVMAFSAEALADQNCDCYRGGYNAFKSAQSCSGRSTYCPKDVWEQGCYDARHQDQRYRQKWCGGSGGASAGNGSRAVEANWYARGYKKGVGYVACGPGFYGAFLSRGDICYRCADGRARNKEDLLMSGDGRLVCR